MRITLHILFALFLLTGGAFGQTKMVLKEVTKVDGQLNTDAEESLPLFSPNGRLYFVRTLFDQNVGGALSGQDIWYADVSGDTWTSASNEIYPLNNVFNNGVVGVADSGRTLYLHGSYSTKPEYQYGLSVTHYEDGKWSKPKTVRIKGFNPYSPYLNFYVNDKKGIMVLSFADRKNPQNEDIYVSFRVKDNVWSKPEPLGPQINTDSAEFSPFVSEDGKTLYFSSNGHDGFGSFDVFSAYRMDDTWKQWTSVQNMGEQINTKDFEAYYTQYGTEAYFSSNRDSKLSDLYRAEFEIVEIEKRPEVAMSGDMTKENLFAMKGYLDIKNPGRVGMVRVMDINGNVVERVKPNDDGSFEIRSMEKFSRYSVDLNGQEGEIDNLEIFFVNADGSRVYLNEGIVAGQYPFETLERDIKAVLMAEVDEEVESALFKFVEGGDVPAGASIYLYDENGRQRETAVVNRKGEFAFKSMRNGGVYRIEAEGGTITPNTKVYYVNSGEQIEISGNILKGALFKKMQGAFEEVEEKPAVASSAQNPKMENPLKPEVVAEEDLVDTRSEVMEASTFGFEYGQLPPEGTRVTLVDEYGNVVEEAFTDAEGLFKFKRLQSDKNYSIKLDETADVSKGLSMYLVDSDGLQRPLAKSVVTGESFSGSVASETVATEEEEVFTFNYNALPPVGSKVYLTDENDNVVDSAYVDAEGNFKFKKLSSDKAYLMRLADAEDNSGGLDYMVVDASGKEHKLSTEEEKGDAIVAVEESPKAPLLTKEQFAKFAFDYQNLPKDGSKVYLTDDKGNVVDSSFVDSKGNFRFKKLDPSKSYLFKVDDEDFDMDAAALYAVSGGRKRTLKKLPGSFSYDGLTMIAATDTELDASKFQMEYEGDIPEQAQAYLYDEETNEIVETAEIADDGSFSFRKLNPDRKYNIRFDEEIDNSKAKYFPIEVVELVEKRQPTPLKPSEPFALIPPVDERKETVQVAKEDVVNKTVFEDPSELEEQPALSDLNADWVLYFGFNEFLLTPENIAEVKKIAKTLKEDETLMVRVDGHADNLGSEDVNYRMSVLRISNVIYHLEIRGIDETRMEVKPFGELKPVADNSTEEGRAKNRRVEIHVSKKKN